MQGDTSVRIAQLETENRRLKDEVYQLRVGKHVKFLRELIEDLETGTIFIEDLPLEFRHKLAVFLRGVPS